jgi:hypothetical protein
VTVDVNNSGLAGAKYDVVVAAPACVSVKPVKLSELDADNMDDVPCFASGAAQNTGIVGVGTSGNSLCAKSNWDVSASYTPTGEATPIVTTHQGVATRVTVGAGC